LRCLRHLQAIQAQTACEIAVIDDGSDDGTREAVVAEFPAVHLVPGDGRLWWTGAIAIGMKTADLNGASAVIWLNDDCLPEADTLSVLIDRAVRRGPAIAGAVCRTEAGAEVPTAFVGRQRRSVPPDGQAELAVDGLSGYCVAVARPVWTRIGFPDADRFPHYYGDTAYSLRARNAGFDVRLCAQATARLVVYSTPKATPGAYRKSRRDHGWREVFLDPRSPFRAATQWHYLRLRYGVVIGTLLALARLARWQLSFIAAARDRAEESSAGP
jgi:GT2 family glycosyltransferase